MTIRMDYQITGGRDQTRKVRKGISEEEMIWKGN